MKAKSYSEKERSEFIHYLEKIKSFGYRVRISNSKRYNYAYIIDEHNVVGYCEKDYFIGVNLGTYHHPNRKFGTGFNIGKMITLDKLTRDLVLRCFCIVPQGYASIYTTPVKKVIIDDGSIESKRILGNTTEF